MRVGVDIVRGGMVALVAAAAMMGMEGPALAAGFGNGNADDGGYSASAGTVRVTFSGDGAPGGGGSAVARIASTCWWSSDDIVPDANDPVAVRQWYITTMPTINGSFAFARAGYGDLAVYDAAVAAAAAGAQLTCYHAQCQSDAEGCPIEDLVGEVIPTPAIYRSYECTGIPVANRFFTRGQPPAPLVDPESLQGLRTKRS